MSFQQGQFSDKNDFHPEHSFFNNQLSYPFDERYKYPYASPSSEGFEQRTCNTHQFDNLNSFSNSCTNFGMRLINDNHYCNQKQNHYYWANLPIDYKYQSATSFESSYNGTHNWLEPPKYFNNSFGKLNFTHKYIKRSFIIKLIIILSIANDQKGSFFKFNSRKLSSFDFR